MQRKIFTAIAAASVLLAGATTAIGQQVVGSTQLGIAVAELRDVGVRHLLCQTGFGAMSHEQNLASMQRFGEQVMPAFRQ